MDDGRQKIIGELPAAVRRAVEAEYTLYWRFDNYNKDFVLHAITYTWETGKVRTKRLWVAKNSTWHAAKYMNDKLIEIGAHIDARDWETVAERRFFEYGVPYLPGQTFKYALTDPS